MIKLAKRETLDPLFSADPPDRIADSPMTTAIVTAVATKTNRVQLSFEKAR